MAMAILALLLVLGVSSTALAASSDSIVAGGTGLGGNFDKQLAVIGGTFVTLAKVTVLIMTAAAAIMVGWGIEDGKKTIWSWLLGAGLAINFGAFLTETGIVDMASSAGTGPATPHFYEPDIKDEVKDMDILSGFMDSYLNGVIKPGSQAILSPCLKLLLILTILEVGWEMSFKLISGDKVKYLMSVIIKMGIFMFLMMNWIDLMGALGQGFQQIGFLAGGAGGDGADLKPDSIYKNGFKIFTTFWENSSFKSIGLVLLNLVGLLTVVIAMILTSIEMFMARIEFYTMALITIPLLPFIMLNKFAFLAEKAIGGMFNLAIKLSVISFISAMAIPFMMTFQTKMAAAKDPWTQPALLFQAVLAALVIYMLTKKIPELVTSLLNGQPNLNGAGMMDMAKGAANTAVGATAGGVGAVRGASALATGAGNGGVKGTLTQLGKAKLMSTAPVARYRQAIRAMDDLRTNSGSRMLNNMNAGRSALQDERRNGSNNSGVEQGNATKSAETYKMNTNSSL